MTSRQVHAMVKAFRTPVSELLERLHSGRHTEADRALAQDIASWWEQHVKANYRPGCPREDCPCHQPGPVCEECMCIGRETASRCPRCGWSHDAHAVCNYRTQATT